MLYFFLFRESAPLAIPFQCRDGRTRVPSGRLKDEKIGSRQVKFCVQGHIKVRDGSEVRHQRSWRGMAMGLKNPHNLFCKQGMHKNQPGLLSHPETGAGGGGEGITRETRLLVPLPSLSSCCTELPIWSLFPPSPLPQCQVISGLSEKLAPFKSPHPRVAKDMSPWGRHWLPPACPWTPRPARQQMPPLSARCTRAHCVLVTTLSAEYGSEHTSKAWPQGAGALLEAAAEGGSFSRKCYGDPKRNEVGHRMGRSFREDFSEEGTVELTGR